MLSQDVYERSGSLTVHPEFSSAPPEAVKDHCLAHMRTACDSAPPVFTSMSVVTVSVRRAMGGHHANSIVSTVSLGCLPAVPGN